MTILVSDEKFFDIDGFYNSQNERVSAVNRADAGEGEMMPYRHKSLPRESDDAIACMLLQESHTLGHLR